MVYNYVIILESQNLNELFSHYGVSSMKTKIVLGIFILFAFSLLGGCCSVRTVEYTGQVYTPVYKDLNEVRNSVKVSAPRQLNNPGKIYVYGQYLLINERKEGIHVIDNSTPTAPNNIAFIEIPGNGDMAVRSNILYADSYIDLIAIDISNPNSAFITKRVEGIFPNLLDIDNMGGHVDPEKGLLVDYIIKDTVYKYSYRDCGDDVIMSPDLGNGGFTGDGREVGNDATAGAGGPTGIGGSMARFTLYSNCLYSVDGTNLQVFDISSPADPKVWSKVSIGWEIETIYPFKDRLFIGSRTGMYIYSVNDPKNPRLMGEFMHARACDPVVADDNYAYVTLRQGTRCPGNANQLDVLDIRDLSNPKLIKSYPMQEPAGLGLDKNTLFICDGPAGLKVFDVTKPEDIQLLDWKSDIKTFDVIPLGKSLLMIGEDGFFQYDYTDPKNLILLSKIPIVKK